MTWSSTECIDLTSTVNAGKPIAYWLKDLQLYEADKQSLNHGKWLTDNIMDAAQALLRKAYPYIGGLESVSLGQTLAFTIQRGCKSRMRPITIGSLFRILDASLELSMFLTASPTTLSLFAQRSKLQPCYSVKKKDIQLHFKQVQVQHGYNDCGVFAVAFATALCSGKDPSEINFVQHKLRTHLMNCLQRGSLTDFPQTQRKRTKQRKSELNISRSTVFAGNQREER